MYCLDVNNPVRIVGTRINCGESWWSDGRHSRAVRHPCHSRGPNDLEGRRVLQVLATPFNTIGVVGAARATAPQPKPASAFYSWNTIFEPSFLPGFFWSAGIFLVRSYSIASSVPTSTSQSHSQPPKACSRVCRGVGFPKCSSDRSSNKQTRTTASNRFRLFCLS